jgi:ferredoxin
MSYTITDACLGCTACVRVCPTGAIRGEKKAMHVIDAALCIECGACGRVCAKSAVIDDRGTPIERLKKSLWPKPRILRERCHACENCVQACPAGALAMKDEELPLAENFAVLAAADKCVSCGWCESNCLFDAIIMEVPVKAIRERATGILISI